LRLIFPGGPWSKDWLSVRPGVHRVEQRLHRVTKLKVMTHCYTFWAGPDLRCTWEKVMGFSLNVIPHLVQWLGLFPNLRKVTFAFNAIPTRYVKQGLVDGILKSCPHVESSEDVSFEPNANPRSWPGED